MLDYQQSQFDQLENEVRQGKNVNCPKVLYDYLWIGDHFARSRPAVIRHKTYERMYQTLLDTICDPLIAKHWRCTCLDNINRPLLGLQKCAKTCCEKRQVMLFYKELSIVSQYYL